jgi:hypothetical protein
MKLFMLKATLIAGIMFISVLFGMQQANEGIHKMKGYEDQDFKSALSIDEGNQGELEASILGNDVTSHDIDKKREQLEEMKVYNFFSSLGKQLANGVTLLTELMLKFITGLIGK